MRTFVVDYETYYDKEYSLRKMTVPEYILDPRYETIGVAVKDISTAAGSDAIWYEDPMEFFKTIDPNDTCLVSHNALFDMAITSWVYEFVPRLMVDTLGLARATLAHKLKSLALASVGDHLGVGQKGNTVHKVIGMRIGDMKAAGIYDEYARYSLNDAEICAAIYNKIVRVDRFSLSELIVMDSVIRCAVLPQFELDEDLLAQHLAQVRADKQVLLNRLGLTREELLSNDKFAEALMRLDVDPPRKISLVTQKETWAFARTDPEFMELEDHPNPDVQALHAARLGIKSTLEETRTERFLKIARLPWKGERALMPMPLKYAGAHTHRFSGEWKLNVQNLTRGSKLRQALKAPEGFSVLAADASQIEARIVAALAGEAQLVRAFAEGRDVYAEFASHIYNKPINKKDDPLERFIGKTAILGLGYGMGAEKFARTVKLQSKSQLGQELDMSPDDAKGIVLTYRNTYACIPQLWTDLGRWIQVIANGAKAFTHPAINYLRSGTSAPLPVVFEEGRVQLPSGLYLYYSGLSHNNDSWSFTYGGKKKFLWGGSLLENITQALARIVVMEAATRIRNRVRVEGLDARFVLQVHDELVYIVKDEDLERTKAIALEEMRRPPSWLPIIPLDAEAGVGKNYGDAK